MNYTVPLLIAPSVFSNIYLMYLYDFIFRCNDNHSQYYDSELSVILGVLTTGLYIVSLYPSVPGGDSGKFFIITSYLCPCFKM